ncbi:MAG TPA: DUF438 domain-containing protein [Bacteroidales bacterium]|nr:DUF438 domain-containing protein [Bacteroidales bacterium]HPE54996.1 DUF438 domain-containing protein [Bacteroidales bacterium]HRX97250.1 DUF438 domain-containing protein [Bacteroidales bacterium]
MSELINNSEKRKELLKHMILQIHAGENPDMVREQLIRLMSKIPYGEVVEVEQELISDGILTDQEVLQFCDLHTEALEGHIDQTGAQEIPAGHPVDVFQNENRELEKVIAVCNNIFAGLDQLENSEQVAEKMLELRHQFNQLMDVDKHYQRKENLLFPYLEKIGVTGPPKVMWGKHDEVRNMLKGAIEALSVDENVTPEEATAIRDMVLKPATEGIADMVMKEEEILFPMSMDKLTDADWFDIAKQTNEIGYCLYDPQEEWKPEGVDLLSQVKTEGPQIQLPSGSFTNEELTAMLNTLPIDMTFVDKNDKVKYFSQGAERIFQRNRAILNRDVRMCHPPSSVHIVDQIVDDFKSGRQDSAPFWIQMKGMFIHIEYFAMRNEKGEYLGTLEVSQNLTGKRALEGEQRILSYGEKGEQ